MHERQIAPALVSAQAIGLNCFEIHVRCKMIVSEIIDMMKIGLAQVLCWKHHTTMYKSF